MATCCGKTFCHKENFRQNARGDEILPCGKTFCHNYILPHKKIVEISSTVSLLQFKFSRNPDEILTKKNVAKSCGKTFCHKAPDEKSDEIPTKLKRKKQRRKSLYQKVLQVVGNHGGVRSLYIYIPIHKDVYIYICYIHVCVCVNMLSFLHALDIQAFNTLFLHIYADPQL